MANLSPIWWLAHQCALWEHTPLIGPIVKEFEKQNGGGRTGYKDFLQGVVSTKEVLSLLNWTGAGGSTLN